MSQQVRCDFCLRFIPAEKMHIHWEDECEGTMHIDRLTQPLADL